MSIKYKEIDDILPKNKAKIAKIIFIKQAGSAANLHMIKPNDNPYTIRETMLNYAIDRTHSLYPFTSDIPQPLLDLLLGRLKLNTISATDLSDDLLSIYKDKLWNKIYKYFASPIISPLRIATIENIELLVLKAQNWMDSEDRRNNVISIFDYVMFTK